MTRFEELLKRPVMKLVMILLLVGWIGWLRGPSLAVPMWNVDETIHATVAEVLLDGGTLYRDAIDQRTPLTYFVTTAVFAVTDSSLMALRLLILLMICATALALGRIAFRVNGPFTGFGATLIFAAFSSYLLNPEDTFAAHTEWFVVFFTTGAAWCFISGSGRPPTVKRCFATGTFLGLAIMSKQSALLDVAPAFAALIAFLVDKELGWRAAVQRVLAILAGVLASALIISAPVLLSGAGADYLYYTWTYNLEIYGAEFTFAEKVWSGRHIFDQVLFKYPILLITGIVSVVWLFARCMQFKPIGVSKTRRAGEVYILIWLITSTGSAMAGGRGFDHYFFPILAPLAWACAMGPAVWFRQITESDLGNRVIRALAWLTLFLVSCSVLIIPMKAPRTPPPAADPAIRVSHWINQHSTDVDRIFVWGFNPDIYRYSDRLPASRFIYCTFQTGMIPWTNVDPDLDTDYAVVDGALDTLVADLKRNLPKFIVDSSAGPHRFFGKYPLRKFPQLESWLLKNYVELEPPRWRHQGFRLYLRADETVEQLGEISPDDDRGELIVFGTNSLTPGPNKIGVTLNYPSTDTLTGLGLSINGEIVAMAPFIALENTSIQVNVNIPPESKTVILRPLVRFGIENWLEGQRSESPIVSSVPTSEQKAEFSIPLIEGNVEALRIRAQFGARVDINDGVSTFAMHAPALLTYALPADTIRISGRFGLSEGAYAADNPSPSDGAEFIIRHVSGQDSPTEYFRRLIEPLRNSEDVGEQAFNIDIPSTNDGDTIELEITNGPAGDGSSDWTYWSDIKLQTSL